MTILQRQQVQTSGTPKPPQLSRFTRTHLTFSGMWSTSSANNNISAAFSSSGYGGWISGWFGSTKYPVTNGSPITWEIAGTYNLGKRLRIGLDMGEVPNWEVVGTNSLAESIAGKSYGISIHYVPRPYVTQNFSRWEIAYGAGVSYNSLMIDVHNRYSSSSHFSSKYKKIGLQFNCTFGYYFSKLFSIQLKINGKVVPKIVVPEIDIIDRYSNQMLQQHSVNFSMLNFSVGLGFHLGASLKK